MSLYSPVIQTCKIDGIILECLRKSLHNTHGIYQRIRNKSPRKPPQKYQRIVDDIEFTEYDEKYLNDSQKLNKDWLKSYLELTEHDIKVLSDPYNEIINNNGNIFFLVSKNEVIGTYALLQVNRKECELQKFTIKEKYRGRKLGKQMLEHAIEKARSLKYESIVLMTHPKLKKATQLYKKTGFKVIHGHPDLTNQTGRCSIYMQMDVSKHIKL